MPSSNTIKKSETASRSDAGLALLLLPAADLELFTGRVHESLWNAAGFDEALSMHGGACESEMRWRRGRRGQHRRRMPLL